MKKQLQLVFAALLISCSFNLHAGVTKWEDFSLVNGTIRLPGAVDGRPGWVIIDSGANIHGVNLHFMQAHNIALAKSGQTMLEGVYGREKRDVFTHVPITLFGAEFTLDDVVATPFGGKSDALLLGTGFLRMFIFQFDYPNERMRFMTHDAINLKKLKNLTMDIDRDSGRPIVKVRLNDEKDVWLLLDTGNSGGILLDRRFVKTTDWLDKFPRASGMARGVNTVGVNEHFNLPIMELGPFDLENVVVSTPAEGQKANVLSQFEERHSRIRGRKVVGILGYDVLKHFVLTVDYKRGFGHIAPPST